MKELAALALVILVISYFLAKRDERLTRDFEKHNDINYNIGEDETTDSVYPS